MVSIKIQSKELAQKSFKMSYLVLRTKILKFESKIRRELTITHDSVTRTFSNVEIIRPSCQVGHIEGHVKLYKVICILENA